MRSSADPPPSPADPPPSPAVALHNTVQLLNHLLPATMPIHCFPSRWQVIRSKLAAVSSLLSKLSDCPHWSENSLVVTLLPELLSTLRRTEILSRHCLDASSFSRGKLLMQSDLDMAAGWLSKQINDLELLLRSGVLHKSTAIVLSRPDMSSSDDEIAFFVRDLFTRLQIGCPEFQREALESLIHLLSEYRNSAAVVAGEANVRSLISLLYLNGHESIQELAVTAVSLLVASGDSPRNSAFEEGALGPLLKIIESGPMPIKEKAAMAVELITSDPDNAWAISAYGGVRILTELCKSGSLPAQSHAAGSLRNISAVENLRTPLAEEGAISILTQLLLSASPSAQAKAANCISILASTNDHFRSLLLQEKALQRLLHLFHNCSNPATFEQVFRTIYSLSVSDSCYRTLSASTAFVEKISELLQHGNMMVQQISAALLANLAISDDNKRAISGCMGFLVKMMESLKPDGMQELGAKALVSLLSVKSNRKEFVRDEKSLVKLVQMLDPENDVVSKKYPVGVVAAVMAGGSQDCRKKLVAAGAYMHLQRLNELEVAGAKKALQRLSSNKLTSLLRWKWIG